MNELAHFAELWDGSHVWAVTKTGEIMRLTLDEFEEAEKTAPPWRVFLTKDHANRASERIKGGA